MKASRSKWYGIIIAAISLVMVLGALLTALAQSEFHVEQNNQGQFTATMFDLPTQTEDANLKPSTTSTTEEDTPPEASATDTPSSQQVIETPTQELTTNTPSTFTPTNQQSGAASECGVPAGWNKYTVKSGDTLFSISVKYQTTVDEVKNANCLVYNTIITGSTLWVPNNATITPTKTPTKAPTNTPKPTNIQVTCYGLTLSVASGSGSAPVASPTKSDGCDAGKYTEGEVISLTAAPDSGWAVSAWNGTDDDGLTTNANTLTMPASAQAVSVTYSKICYTLSLSVAGGVGAVPSADPTNSTGCSAGSYHAGESITLTANPDIGWAVSSWTGTTGGAPTDLTNTLTMPASTHAASVTYEAICYTLSLSVDGGSGAVPTADPASSSGCAAGSFHAGVTITLTAAPDPGWEVTSWTGTTGGAPTDLTNTLTMPASSHAASVLYGAIP
jgi:LysM repeat protein